MTDLMNEFSDFLPQEVDEPPPPKPEPIATPEPIAPKPKIESIAPPPEPIPKSEPNADQFGELTKALQPLVSLLGDAAAPAITAALNNSGHNFVPDAAARFIAGESLSTLLAKTPNEVMIDRLREKHGDEIAFAAEALLNGSLRDLMEQEVETDSSLSSCLKVFGVKEPAKSEPAKSIDLPRKGEGDLTGAPAKIYEWLKNHGGSVTSSQLCEGVATNYGMSESYLPRFFTPMVKAGWLSKGNDKLFTAL